MRSDLQGTERGRRGQYRTRQGDVLRLTERLRAAGVTRWLRLTALGGLGVPVIPGPR